MKAYYFALLEDKNQLLSQIFALQTKVESLHTELELSRNQEQAYRDLEQNFQAVCKANNEMKVKIDELTNEIWNRDKVVTEWNETLGSINAKIAELEAEKAGMTWNISALSLTVAFVYSSHSRK